MPKIIIVTCSKCRERSQSWKDKRGLAMDEFYEAIGWRKQTDGWWCPFCTGITGPLKKIFRRGTDPGSYGKRQR
jgi:hypothetical protein